MADDISHIRDLKSDPKNARKHSARGVGMIVNALHEVGAARSGVIDEDGRVLAGNATLEALGQAGIEKVKVVDAGGDEWVVVRRKGLTEQQKEALALYDNRTAELSGWDLPVLQNVEMDLTKLFYNEEIDKLFADNNGQQENVEPELQFGAELMERQDYLILRFTNELDWQNAVQTFNVKSVKVGSAKDVRVEKYGRVLDGAAVLKMLKGSDENH